jgi:predicted hydrocarbon binding protein
MDKHSWSHFPDGTMGQVLLCSVAEVIGTDYMDTVIDRTLASDLGNVKSAAKDDEASSLRTVSLLQMELEHAYGHRGGQGLALLSGRNFFNHAMRLNSDRLGFTSSAFLLKTLPQKIEVTLQAMAELFNQFSDHQAVIETSERGIYWRLKRCPFCWERNENDPICHFTIGLLQEALYWVSGGKIYPVEETTCLACGDPECLIVIGRTPLE